MTYETERLLVIVQLSSVMAAMGAKLRRADFGAVFRRPMPLAWGLVCQFVVAPLLALAAVRFGVNEPRMALGLIVVSAMPGGPMSTLLTHLGRGNAALAVSLTALTTLASVFTLPLTLPFLAGASLKTIVVPGAVVLRETTPFLFLPLAFGGLVHWLSPKFAARLAVWGVRLATVLLSCYVVLSLTSGRIRPAAFGWTPAFTIIAFCLVSMQVAMLPFRLFGWPPRDRLAVGIEMTIRDVNLALLLKTRLETQTAFDERGDPMLYGILFFAGSALVIAVITAMIFRYVLHPEKLAAN